MFPVISLLSLALLTLFAVNLTDGGRHNLALTELSLARTQARSMAESGLARALSVVASDTTLMVDAHNEPWSDSPASFRDQELTSGRYSVFRWRDPAATGPLSAEADSIFGLEDEESKLNVLVTPTEVLGRLPEFPRTLLWIIQNWQDSRDAPAEERQPSWTPSLIEFAAQAGLSRDVAARVSRLVTTHGNGKLNLNTVSYEVLGALGVSASLRGKIMNFRAGADKVAGTEDDGVFTDPSTIAVTLGEAVSLSSREAAEASRLQSSGDMTVFSRHFRVHATGIAACGPGHATIEAVVHRPASGPPVIVERFES